MPISNSFVELMQCASRIMLEKYFMALISIIAQKLIVLQTHPKFLHSNSTSHIWAFGAIAELIGMSIRRIIFS